MNEQQRIAFDEFWQAWPKKEAKKDAIRAWERIAPDKYQIIMAALLRHKKKPSWSRGIIPHPATWLNGERWEDEIKLPEDDDADMLIQMLRNEFHMPHEFPERLHKRYHTMCLRIKANWPKLHDGLSLGTITEDCIRKEFLATN